MMELKLEPVTKKMLNYLRTSTTFLPVYDMPSDLAEAAVWGAGFAVGRCDGGLCTS